MACLANELCGQNKEMDITVYRTTSYQIEPLNAKQAEGNVYFGTTEGSVSGWSVTMEPSRLLSTTIPIHSYSDSVREATTHIHHNTATTQLRS